MNNEAQRNPRLPDCPGDNKDHRRGATENKSSSGGAPAYEELLGQRNAAWRALRRYRACYDFLFSHPDLRGEAVAREVGLFLERQTNQFGKESDCLTIEQIASGVGAVNSGTGRNQRHIQRKLRLLESLGYVSVTAARKESISRGNIYRINYDLICEWLNKYRSDKKVQGEGCHQSTYTNDATQYPTCSESSALAIASLSLQITVESNTGCSTGPDRAVNDCAATVSAAEQESPDLGRRAECNNDTRPCLAVEDVSELLNRLVALVRDDFSVLGVPNASTARNVLVAARARVPQTSIEEVAKWIERKLVLRGPRGPAAFQSWGGVVTALREDYPTVWEEKRKSGPRCLTAAAAPERPAIEKGETRAGGAGDDRIAWAIAEYERQFGPIERLTDEVERWISECANRYPGRPPEASSESGEPAGGPAPPEDKPSGDDGRSVSSNDEVNARATASERDIIVSQCCSVAVIESPKEVDDAPRHLPVPVPSVGAPGEVSAVSPHGVDETRPVGARGRDAPRGDSAPEGDLETNDPQDGHSSMADASSPDAAACGRAPPRSAERLRRAQIQRRRSAEVGDGFRLLGPPHQSSLVREEEGFDMQVANQNSVDLFAEDYSWLDIRGFDPPRAWHDIDCRPRLEECPECGGSGLDAGGLSASEPTDCPTCAGSGRVLRDYLSEALRIIRGRERAAVQREHLLAVVQFFGEVIRAVSPVAERSCDAAQ